jgi:hypothetical protein
MIYLGHNKHNTPLGKTTMKKFLTVNETENMTLEQFAEAIRKGKIEVRKEFSNVPTVNEVTMNGRFDCE